MRSIKGDDLGLQRRKTAREQMYDRLKRAILTCELAPGSSWSESELIARYGTGRTPIHEALQQLAQEGLLTILPRRGILISDISFSHLQQMFELRLELEQFCVRLAAQRITPAEIEEGRRILAAPYDGRDGMLDHHLGLDRQFHALTYAAARNTFLESMLRRLYDWSLRVLYHSKSRMESLAEVQSEHQNLLDALAAGDEERAAAVIHHHVHKFRESVRAAL